MTTAVDTNVLLDLISTDESQRDSSLARISAAAEAGAIIVGEVVFAELSPGLLAQGGMQRFLDEWGIAYEPSTWDALEAAGGAFREYLRTRRGLACAHCGTRIDATCPSCGVAAKGRQHVLPDFMIGAHALVHAGRLLTRDRGYYAKYFPELVLV